jgi:hypothetical protein
LANTAEYQAAGTAHQSLKLGQSSLRVLTPVAQAQEENLVTSTLVEGFPAAGLCFGVFVWSDFLRIKAAKCGQVVFA